MLPLPRQPRTCMERLASLKLGGTLQSGSAFMQRVTRMYLTGRGLAWVLGMLLIVVIAIAGYYIVYLQREARAQDTALETARRDLAVAKQTGDSAIQARRDVEAKIRAAETGRAEAEAKIRAAEIGRAEAEAKIRSAETGRAEAEAKIRSAESARAEAEAKSKSADAARADSEAKLKAAEAARADLEAKLKAAETARAEAEAKLKAATEKQN